MSPNSFNPYCMYGGHFRNFSAWHLQEWDRYSVAFCRNTCYCAEQPTQTDVSTLTDDVSVAPGVVIRNAQELSAAAILMLKSFGQSLQMLRIHNIQPNVAGDAESLWIFEIFRRCTNLLELELGAVAFSQKFLAEIGSSGGSLKRLKLKETINPEDQVLLPVENFSFSCLTALSGLEAISIQGFGKLSPQGLFPIKDLRNLRFIELDSIPCVNDEFVGELLKTCKTVTKLSLINLRITKRTLQTISELPNLTHVTINSCLEIPADKFVILRINDAIQVLDLCHTLADDTLFNYAPANVKELYMVGCPISQVAMTTFRQNHPSVLVNGMPPLNSWF